MQLAVSDLFTFCTDACGSMLVNKHNFQNFPFGGEKKLRKE